MKTPGKPSGFVLDIEGAPPPDKLGKGAPAAEDDAGDDEGKAEDMSATSAIHDLARAFGVQIKDEKAAIQAVYDLMDCKPASGE